MERINMNELALRLAEQPQDDDGMKTSEVVVLEDTIWGLEDGSYKALGELQLPLQYATGEFDWGVDYEMFTIFNHNFYDGIVQRWGDSNPDRRAEPMYSREVLDTYSDDSKCPHIDAGGSTEPGGTSIKQAMQDFVKQFFDRYAERDSINDEEAKACLQRSFAKYD